MAEASIPVDLRNPGQVFACLGLMEAAEVLHPDPSQLRRQPVMGRYDWIKGEVNARFTLSAPGKLNPIEEVISFLSKASVRRWRPKGLQVQASKSDSGADVDVRDGVEAQALPFSPPDGIARLPVSLDSDGRVLKIEYWGDMSPAGLDDSKFWAGNVTGYLLTCDALALVRGSVQQHLETVCSDPFSFAAPQSSSFNFDWRRSYTPVDAGFSPNVHGSMTMVGFPLVELLAAIGLQNARPERPDRRDKLLYRYAVSSAELPLVLARPTLGGADLGFPLRRFRIQLGWPGQEGQARCIKTALEDTP